MEILVPLIAMSKISAVQCQAIPLH